MPEENKRQFKQVLTLPALVLFGLSFVGPTAPYAFWELGSTKSNGHFALVYFIATIAICLTAISYGKMSRECPSSGSAYAYATKFLHPYTGQIIGWILILDYILIPIISYIILGISIHAHFPSVSYEMVVIISGVLVLAINLQGIKTTSWFTMAWFVIALVSVVIFIGSAIYMFKQNDVAYTTAPFYYPANFSYKDIIKTMPVAILCFLGFEGVSTLAEDAKNPRKNIFRAMLITCLLSGFIFIILSYTGQLIYNNYDHTDNRLLHFSDLGYLVGGSFLMYYILFLVTGQAFASAVASQTSGSRIMFRMAKDNKIPNFIFGHLNATNTPTRSILVLGVIEIIVALFLNLEDATSIVNFGSLLAFMAVNASAFIYNLKNKKRNILGYFIPVLGFITCLLIWLHLSQLAMITGVLWIVIGILFYAVRKNKNRFI